jgi:flagellar basal-body rod protein FlgG
VAGFEILAAPPSGVEAAAVVFRVGTRLASYQAEIISEVRKTMPYTLLDIAGVASVKVNQLDLVSNNIANASTPGYKAEHMTASVGDNLPDPVSGWTPRVRASVYIDFSQGVLERTGNNLDVAIQGDGFFEVETPEGVAYTRAGHFAVDGEGTLTDRMGHPVMGEGGRIVMPGSDSATDVRISPNGVIRVFGTEPEGIEAGTLKVVTFEDTSNLKRSANGLFVYAGQGEQVIQEPEMRNIQAGYLELSNTSAVQELIRMVDIQRSFELYQKAIHTISEQDHLSVSRVGRLV